MALARAFYNRIENPLYSCAVFVQNHDYKTLQQYTDSIDASTVSRGYIVPRASDHQITPVACPGRELLTEQ